MKISPTVLLCFLVFSATAVSLRAQEKTLHDSFESGTCEDLLVRLDTFSIHVANNPNATAGQIVMFPGPDPIENGKYEKYLRVYIVRTKLQDKLSLHISSDSRQNLRIELWSAPLGTTAQWKTLPLSTKLSGTRSPIFFDSDLFEMYTEKRKTSFVGINCGACCISNLDWSLLSQFLDANPKLRAYVVIRGRASRHQALKAYLNRDMRGSGLDSNKLTYFFAKKNLVNTAHFSEVAVFLSEKVVRSSSFLRGDLNNY